MRGWLTLLVMLTGWLLLGTIGLAIAGIGIATVYDLITK